MDFDKEKTKLLAENLLLFVQHVKNSNPYLSDPDKHFRVQNLVDEYQFQLIGDELLRLNRFTREGKQTAQLVNRARKGIKVIDEYVENNIDDLFIFSARLYTLRNICESFTTI